MPGLIGVSEFLDESREDYNSPTTSSFVSRMPQCRQTITSLEEVSLCSKRGGIVIGFTILYGAEKNRVRVKVCVGKSQQPHELPADRFFFVCKIRACVVLFFWRYPTKFKVLLVSETAKTMSKKKPTKTKGKSGKNAKNAKAKILIEIDWAAEENFNAAEPLVIVEYDRRCFVYREQAEQFESELRAAFPDRQFRMAINMPSRVGELGPRDGSFELWLAQNARCEPEQLWSGVGSGPPRVLKFPPDYAEFWPRIQKILMRFYKAPSVENVGEEIEEV